MKYALPIIAAIALAGCSDHADESINADDVVTAATPPPPIRDLLKCALRTRNLERPSDPSMDLNHRVFIDLDTTGFTKVSRLYSSNEPDPDRYRIDWEKENASPRVFRTDDVREIAIFNGGAEQQGSREFSRYDGKIFCFGGDQTDRKVGSFSQSDHWRNFSRPFGEIKNACFRGLDIQTMEYFSTNEYYLEEGDCQRY